MSIGFVYVMTNEAMPGLSKIGMTLRSPHARALALAASTGVPWDFKVEFYVEVREPSTVERRAHTSLANHRFSNSREFFAVSPADAARAILEFLDGEQLSEFRNDTVAIALEEERLASIAADSAIRKAAA